MKINSMDKLGKILLKITGSEIHQFIILFKDGAIKLVVKKLKYCELPVK